MSDVGAVGLDMGGSGAEGALWVRQTGNNGGGIGSISQIGDCVVKRYETHSTCLRADERIAVSRELLTKAAAEDWPEIVIDGPYLGICGEVAYRATGEVYEGEPVYERVTAWEPPPVVMALAAQPADRPDQPKESGL